MTKETNEHTHILSSALDDRLPVVLIDFLEDMWRQHMHTDSSIKTSFPLEHFSYGYGGWHQIGFALEQMYQIGLIKNGKELFDSCGKLKPNLSRTALDRFVGERMLVGSNIAVVGGVEGRVFAEMGAQVTNFDPHLNKIPSFNLPNLIEIPERFDGKYAVPYWEQFDVAYSHDLFDPGSSLSPHNELEQYKSYLTMILWSTKEGGISIHNGGRMVDIADNSLCTVREIAPSHQSDRIGSRQTIYSLQKLKDTTPYT